MWKEASALDDDGPGHACLEVTGHQAREIELARAVELPHAGFSRSGMRNVGLVVLHRFAAADYGSVRCEILARPQRLLIEASMCVIVCRLAHRRSRRIMRKRDHGHCKRQRHKAYSETRSHRSGF